MQLEAIEAFLAVLETGGFHAAARKLGVTQTTVSARIRSLEDAVGNRVFERGASGTALSEFGQEFRPFAEEMISLWKIASTELPDRVSNRISLRIGAQLSIWDPLLVDLAIHLEKNFGKLVFALNFDHVANVSEAVASHLLDVALTHEKPTEQKVSFLELPPERLVCVEAQCNEALSGEPPFINLDLGKQYQRHVDAVIDPSFKQNLFLGNCLMGLRYLLKRGGRGLFPLLLLEDYLASGQLRLIGKDIYPLPCYLVHRPESPSADQLAEVGSCLAALRAKTG
ncbi:LysR family transcriptional regulator [Roseibium sp. SCPC15]|uniref:LysR family transcriptional regulator n=1 Tax=Roseibium sp. SCP15 TaxID=3141376 RepID=UPI00333AAAA5